MPERCSMIYVSLGPHSVLSLPPMNVTWLIWATTELPKMAPIVWPADLGCVHAYFAKAESAFWNADSKRRSKTPLIQAIVRAQVNRKGVYMTSFKRGYNVILRSCFHQNQRFALTTIVNAHFWAAFMLILRKRFETLIQNADPKRRSRKYCSCFPREEDDTFTEEGMSRNSRNV